MIHALNIEKKFGDFTAVDRASFSVQAGECFGLLGPNGAGKSTLINILYGAAKRDGGELTVMGLDPSKNAREIKRRLGVVTQDNALDESLNVIENMLLYAAFQDVPASERLDRVTNLLDYMNLGHKAKQPIRSLSGGMKRRLVFVRALLGQPDLVILDEPTTGLDPAVRHLLWGKVNELKRQGKTILLTTHYMHEAEVLCDRLVIMNQGKVISDGSPEELIRAHTPGFVAAFNKNSAEQLRPLIQERAYPLSEDSSGLYVRAPELAHLLELQKRAGSNALQLRPANLEDVFLKLTGQELNADA